MKVGKEVAESFDDRTLTNLFGGIDFNADISRGN